MGYPGAVFSDLAMQFFGLASVVALLPAAAWSLMLMAGHKPSRMPRRGFAWLASAMLAAGMVGCIGAPPTWPLPSGLGGVFGDLVLLVPGWLAGGYPTGLAGMVTCTVLALPTFWLLLYAFGLLRRGPAEERAAVEETSDDDDFADGDEDDDDGREGRFALAFGALAHFWLSGRAWLRRISGACPSAASATRMRTTCCLRRSR